MKIFTSYSKIGEPRGNNLSSKNPTSYLIKPMSFVILVYMLVIPFWGFPFWICLLPIALIDIFAINKFSWKMHTWSFRERIGDVISIFTVATLGYLKSNLDLGYYLPMPLCIQYVLGVAIVDTFGYWIHYCAHNFHFLWCLHRVHHSRCSPNIWNASYEHIGDAMFRLIAPSLLLIVMGFDRQVISSITCLTALIGSVSHLNADLNIPKVFMYLIVNPISHRIHHHKDEVAVNNGNITHVWDYIMGTFTLYKMTPDDYGLKTEQQVSDSPLNIFFIPKN